MFLVIIIVDSSSSGSLTTMLEIESKNCFIMSSIILLSAEEIRSSFCFFFPLLGAPRGRPLFFPVADFEADASENEDRQQLATRE